MVRRRGWVGVVSACCQVCLLAPSRGGRSAARGNPERGANPRSTWRPVFILRPFPCERAPPLGARGQGSLARSPMPINDHPRARWVRFLSSPALDVRLLTALQVLQIIPR